MRWRRARAARLSFDPNVVELGVASRPFDKVVNLFGSYGHELIDVLRHLLAIAATSTGLETATANSGTSRNAGVAITLGRS
jgi:hypothetical protein